MLGIGNMLLMDEGAGPAVARHLREECELPCGVDVLDCATMGLALISELRDHDLVIAVDAVDGTGLPPGTVVRFSPGDVARRAGVPASAHDTTFADVIDAARLLGYEPRCECVGIQVANMSPAGFAMELSPAVEAAVPAAALVVLDILAENGIG